MEAQTVRIPLRLGCGQILLSAEVDDQLTVLERLLRAGRSGTFVDVGANIGQSFLALLGAGVRRDYLGFEPDVEACAYLSGLIHQNRFENGAAHALALGDRGGTALMHTRDEFWVGATLTTSMTPTSMYRREGRVPLSTGDVQLAHLRDDEILLIKIDVEGSELSVLRGMQKTLERTGAPVYVEVLAVDHFLDGSYSREYFGELDRGEIEALVEVRVENGIAVEKCLRDGGRRIFEVATDGGIEEIEEIDLRAPRPGTQGERNFLAVRPDDPALAHLTSADVPSPSAD